MNNLKKCIRSPHVHKAILNFGLVNANVVILGLKTVHAKDDPKTATTTEIIEKDHNIISEDSSLINGEIANAVGISDELVLHILHGELHTKKLFGKLVPRI